LKILTNSNNKSAFKVKINTDLHQVNGPNSYPIIVESKKKGKNAVDWDSDCYECRVESSNNIGTSSGNLLFANFNNKLSSCPEEKVATKKLSTKRLIKASMKNGITISSQEEMEKINQTGTLLINN